MGGTDDSTNLVELTIEEHAEAHRELYEQYGKTEDKIAYLGLLTLIGKDQISLETSKLGGELNKGIPKTSDHKIKISETATSKGKKHTDITKKIISNKMKNNTNSASHKTVDYKQKQSNAMKLAWQRRKNNAV